MTPDDFGIKYAPRLAPTRRVLSRIRHAEAPIRIFGLDTGPSALVPPQPAGWSHLVTLRGGCATVVCSGIRTEITSDIAYWVPAGTSYALNLGPQCQLRILYVAVGGPARETSGALTMSALLRELVERAMIAGYLDPANSRDARLLAVIEDELWALRGEPAASSLVLPRDPQLLAAIDRFGSALEERPSIRLLAAVAGMSLRTFERHFTRETGLAPREWLRRARLTAALNVLVSGGSVTEAGLTCGYSSISAFIVAYRAVFGVTPGRTSAALRVER